MSQEIATPVEGRTFFVVVTVLVGIGVTMGIASVAILFIAALAF